MSAVNLKNNLQSHVRADHTLHMSEGDARNAGLPHLMETIMLLKAIGHEIALKHGRDLTVAAKAQVARYPGNGRGYSRHRDNSIVTKPWSLEVSGTTNWRVFTCIAYANTDWQPEDGGKLRIYPDTTGVPQPQPKAWGSRTDRQPSPSAATPTDVEPIGGRVLIFDSLLEHEVMPAFAPRYAVTLWIWREDADEEKYCMS